MKVAIIGGGTCGLYLAWKLAIKEIPVTVFEKKKEIGKEVCSGLFSERIWSFLPEEESLVQNRIRYALLNFPKKTVRVNFSQEFLVVNHKELDRYIFNLAQKAGAKIVLGEEIKRLPKGFEKIIGCDGANSIVRKELGLKAPSLRLGIRGFIPQEDFSDFVETWPTESGFVWRIPRGKKTEYGVIEKGERAKDILGKFTEEKGFQLEDTGVAPIPQGFACSSLPEVALCGDASGLTKPWSGGGVIWGLRAADILLKNFPSFLEYKKELKKSFLLRIAFSRLATSLVYFAGFRTPWLLPSNNTIENDFLL